MSRESIVAQLAPVAPPCFSARDQWVTYLQSAVAAQRDSHAPGPLLFMKGQPVRFNPEFSFCEDCSARHAADMQRARRCNPSHLRDLEIEHAGA